MTYSIQEHRHRFAAWAASRAASIRSCSFKVVQGKEIIESSGLMEIGKSVNNLPDPADFDRHHRKWRESVIKAARERQLTFTHGVAAKLINVYLKAIFVCGAQYDEPRIKAIHPPIDSLLLDALYKENVGGLRDDWQEARKSRWSKLDCEKYEHLIECIKKVVSPKDGLWRIEEYWQGYQ
jgi:hypothetical protein